jgi:hypothetical protein
MTPEEFEKAKEAFNRMKIEMKDTVNIQDKLNKGLGQYVEAIKDIGKIQRNINKAEKDLNKLKEESVKVQKELNDLEKTQEARRIAIAKILKRNSRATATQKKAAQDELDILNDSLKRHKEIYAISSKAYEKQKSTVDSQKEQLEVLKRSVKEGNKLKATWNTSVSALKGVGGILSDSFGKLRSWGVFEMDKELRNAARSMNIGQAGFKGFSNSIERAADKTVVWGVDVKRLAVMQRNYSEEIGRSVQLTESGYEAMALLAEGTGLGDEFATSMAVEMDKFGASVMTSKQLVEETIKKSARMGVNGASAAKKLVSLLKLSQTYVFKGGQEGLKKMANDATKLKLDMEGIAGLAEKVMRPEGAVETAALLTTMGGEFAKLGDPFQLMFKARNDFAGFSKDIGKATSEFVDYNKQTGAFEIKGGLARDRMKEISTITGIQMEKLQEMGAAEKKYQMIRDRVGGRFTNEEDLSLIESLAEVGKNGEIKIKMPGSDPLDLSRLDKTLLNKYRADSANLEKAALQAQTFDEVVVNLITSFKQTLLPFVQGIKDGLGNTLQQLMYEWKREGFYNKLREWGATAAQVVNTFATKIPGLISSIVGFIKNDPIGTGVKALEALFLGWSVLKAATWIANGVSFGLGFRSVAGGLGGMIGASILGVIGAGLAGWGLGKNFGEKATISEGRKSTKEGDTASMWGAGIGLAAGVVAAALAIPTGGASLALLAAGLGGAGAFAGGAGGKYFGDMANQDSKNINKEGEGTSISSFLGMNDGIIQGNNTKQVAKGIKFHPNDKFISVNDTLIAGTDKGKNNELAEAINASSYSSSNGMSGGEVLHKHSGEIKHTGTITIDIPGVSNMNTSTLTSLFNSPNLLSQLAYNLNQYDAAYGRNYGVPQGNKPNNLIT